MYSSPQFIHRTNPYTSYYAPYEYYPYMSPVPSQSTLYRENYPNASSLCSYDAFASDTNRDLCLTNTAGYDITCKSNSLFDRNNNGLVADGSAGIRRDGMDGCGNKLSEPIYYDCDNFGVGGTDVGKGWARPPSLRVLPIREEVYGPI